MAKFELTADELKIDVKKLGLDRFAKLAAQELQNSITRLTQETQKGRNADGGAIKGGYSESYKRAIAKGQVRGRGGVRKNSTSPVDLTISGEFLNSRQVTNLKDGAESRFGGTHSKPPKRPGSKRKSKGSKSISNAELAQHLDSRGFKGFHEFGLKDQLRIEQTFGAELLKAANESITVKKNT